MPQREASCQDAFIIRCGHPMNWAEIIQDVSDQDRSLEEAFSALSISRVGQGNKDVRLVHESTKLYGKALKELQDALFTPKRMYSNHVLMACMFLGLYDILEGPAFNSRGWIAHARGAARLIQLRGPERHQEWDAHHPFLASRIPTIYASMLQRKATYLATEEWLTIPWATQAHRTYVDRLVDLATMIPGILETFDLLRNSEAAIQDDLLRLLGKCKDLQIRMDRWKDGTKKSAIPRTIKHEPADDDGYPFETDFWFENHLFVHARLAYYTSSLVLSEVVEDILRVLKLRAPKLADSLDLAKLKDLLNSDRYAAYICQSVSYCLQPDMGAWGAIIINFPADRALAYYQRVGETATADWLMTTFQNAKTRGFYVESAPNQLPAGPRFKETASRLVKRESSSDSSTDHSDTGRSRSSSQSCTSTATTFVYENPSKYYYDASNDPG
ncbi:hypothetical protein A1O3_00544 [Capronia epimyces CBS 606.96]|uniref:C6 zinc finger domain-containing protein n=1 Tax=Capronia epimyces CBS 606.96 TaxID=1182542 RepID=W9ZBW0_9EURO|nr:uncharacterized protein A1O3_00544 [Capronia epimyces CBS 606.96]EXJ91994.1 hypothetical protein A1O3_00544 [Capronia epimyces CBS 606.96]